MSTRGEFRSQEGPGGENKRGIRGTRLNRCITGIKEGHRNGWMSTRAYRIGVFWQKDTVKRCGSAGVLADNDPTLDWITVTSSKRFAEPFMENWGRWTGRQGDISVLKQTDSLIYRRSNVRVQSYLLDLSLFSSFHPYSTALFPFLPLISLPLILLLPAGFWKIGAKRT